MKVRGLMPKNAAAVQVPVAAATHAASTTSITNMPKLAKKRGHTRYLIGSAPHMWSASICSVTTIEPISAAMPAPTGVASISAQMDAARSRSRTAGKRYRHAKTSAFDQAVHHVGNAKEPTGQAVIEDCRIDAEQRAASQRRPDQRQHVRQNGRQK